MEPKPPITLAPCMPGAVTPFAPFQDATPSSMVPFPPAPPVSFESPRSGQDTARSSYTPGGTRIPDGPPPVTPRQVSFSPTVDYTHVEGPGALPVYEGMGMGSCSTPLSAGATARFPMPPVPPMPPVSLPPPVNHGVGGPATHMGSPSMV